MKGTKKRLVGLLAGMGTLAGALGFAACGETQSNEEKLYQIAWTDGTENHVIEVWSGELYHLEELPTKDGYHFLGLFDAQVGGRQFVSPTGMCTDAFVEDRNLVLYAQYAPKEYTIIFD